MRQCRRQCRKARKTAENTNTTLKRAIKILLLVAVADVHLLLETSLYERGPFHYPQQDLEEWLGFVPPVQVHLRQRIRHPQPKPLGL